jgi:serine/threonine-protein kinase
LVGQGQFGQVFCALHRPTGQLVALKNLEHDRFPTHKFLRELRFLLSLQHPNIVTCRALEHTSTGRYLVMDYCEGGTMRGLMAEESRLSLPHAISLVKDLLAGLDHAHSRGIVHCDIKPENILVQLDPQGWTARISDFGIARLSQEIKVQEGVTGSPAYMAPERFYGQYSAASDLYSVGILMFELMTGYRPFSGTPAELRSAHLNRPLQMPDSLLPIWKPVIAKALQKLARRRFLSAAEMLEALQFAQDADLSGATGATLKPPLFSTVIAPPSCQFKPTTQQPLEQAIIRLAASQPASQNPTSGWLWQATTTQIDCWISTDSRGTALQLQTHGVAPAPVRQLLVRPQGCFVVMGRSLGLLSAAEPAARLQVIDSWAQDRAVAIDPTGRWMALLKTEDSPDASPSRSRLPRQLTFRRLPEAAPAWIASAAIPVTGGEYLEMLALDRRYLALFSQSSNRQGSATAVSLITRRGGYLGSLTIPLALCQLSLTPIPYRLLATDDCAGTVLLLDLKPYRIRRIWVEISPQFLVAADWGYILAAASGRLVFLDQTGQQIGQLNCPAQITALAVWQNQLWIATWELDRGMLYGIALPDLGLDLVF